MIFAGELQPRREPFFSRWNCHGQDMVGTEVLPDESFHPPTKSDIKSERNADRYLKWPNTSYRMESHSPGTQSAPLAGGVVIRSRTIE